MITLTTLVAVVVGAVVGAVFSYLFLRANAQKKAKLDALVEKASAKLKE